MKKHIETPFDSRLEALARSVGEEHSLHLGTAIGNAIVAAWEGVEALGGALARAVRGVRGAEKKVT